METMMPVKDEVRDQTAKICAAAVEATLFLTAGVAAFLYWLLG